MILIFSYEVKLVIKFPLWFFLLSVFRCMFVFIPAETWKLEKERWTKMMNALKAENEALKLASTVTNTLAEKVG